MKFCSCAPTFKFSVDPQIIAEGQIYTQNCLIGRFFWAVFPHFHATAVTFGVRVQTGTSSLG